MYYVPPPCQQKPQEPDRVGHHLGATLVIYPAQFSVVPASDALAGSAVPPVSDGLPPLWPATSMTRPSSATDSSVGAAD